MSHEHGRGGDGVHWVFRTEVVAANHSIVSRVSRKPVADSSRES